MPSSTSSRPRRAAALLALLGFTACTSAPPSAPRSPGGEAAGATAFVDITVIPMDRERHIEKQTVLVQGDRIVAVGPADSLAVPAGAQRIDGRGKYLMPGLMDMHTHLDSTDTLALFVANGVTTVRNMAGRPLDLLWQKRVARGELLGPRIYTTGPIVDGRQRAGNPSAVITRKEDADAIIAAQKKAGYDFVKVYNRLTPEVFAAVVAAARKYSLPVVGHVPGDVGLDAALAAGMSTIEHLQGYFERTEADDSPFRGKWGFEAWLARPFHVSDAKIAEVAANMRAAGTWSCPTLVVDQRYFPTPEQAERRQRAPSYRFVSPLLRAEWASAVERREDAVLASRKRDSEVRQQMVRALRDAHARLLLGTDEGNPFVAPGFSVIEELAALHDAGLSPYEALAAATRSPAEYLGAAGDLGTIAPGRRADLLLVEGDPLVDVANVARRAGVMVHGRWLPEREIQALLERIAASYAPRADRFARRPPLGATTAGASVTTWTVLFGDLEIGNERMSEERAPDGSIILRAQAATDAPDNLWYDARVELDAQGDPRSLRLASEPPEGAGTLELTRTGKRLRLTGELPYHGRIDREETLGDALLIGRSLRMGASLLDGPQVLGARILAARLQAMPAGGEQEIAVRSLQLDPDLDLEEAHLAIQRRPDRTDGLRQYAVNFKSRDYKDERVIALDAAGGVVEIKAGPFTIRRAP